VSCAKIKTKTKVVSIVPLSSETRKATRGESRPRILAAWLGGVEEEEEEEEEEEKRKRRRRRRGRGRRGRGGRGRGRRISSRHGAE